MSEVTVERLEHALALCAYLVVLDGPKAVPIFERIERELAAMRSNEATVVRAKALLANLAFRERSVSRVAKSRHRG
jgi:hypothetical protein